jgi:amino acid transporter
LAQASTTNGDPRGDRRGELSRKLGLFTVLCIGVNNIIGSGISEAALLAHQLGGASWMGFAVDALLLTAVALCFRRCRRALRRAAVPYAKRALGAGPPSSWRGPPGSRCGRWRRR